MVNFQQEQVERNQLIIYCWYALLELYCPFMTYAGGTYLFMAFPAFNMCFSRFWRTCGERGCGGALFLFGALPVISSEEGARVYFEKGIRNSFSGLGISLRLPTS